MISSSKPCEGFRVWLHHELTEDEAAERAASSAMLEEMAERAAAGDAEGASRGASNGGSGQKRSGGSSAAAADESALHIDVTSLAVELPPLLPSARLPVRNWSHFDEVIRGKDYAAASSWVLHLPPEMMLRASGLTIWIGKLTAAATVFSTFPNDRPAFLHRTEAVQNHRRSLFLSAPLFISNVFHPQAKPRSRKPSASRPSCSLPLRRHPPLCYRYPRLPSGPTSLVEAL